MVRLIVAAAVAGLGLVPAAAPAQTDIRTERVQFARGAESATVEGRITGNETVDYLLRAAAGQPANISLASQSASVTFNVMAPGAEWEAVHLGATAGPQFEGVLDASGDWRIRVYQLGNARDAGLTNAYRLEMIVSTGPGGSGGAAGTEGDARAETPYVPPEEGGPRRWEVVAEGGLRMHTDAAVASPVIETLAPGAILSNLGCTEAGGRTWCDVQPFQGGARGWVAAEFLAPAIALHGAPLTGEDDSAARAGRGEFDATAPATACAIGGGTLETVCSLGVARGGGGDATVVIAFPDGVRRALFFQRGEFVGVDASEAGGGFDTDWSKDADGTYRIRVDDERYAFPEAVVFGG
ncbi:MAG: hypothetical protein ACFBSD_09775 [Paracoccaceae bacterium]